jgi:glutamate carboxypeptidase
VPASRLDPYSIPFDRGSMVRDLRSWVECESPSWDAAAVNRMADLVSLRLALLGANVTRIPGREGFGDCIRATFAHPELEKPGILILGHLDTVHPLGTILAFPWREENGLCFGPGVLDMKSGILVALEALAGLQRVRWQTSLPLTVILTSDEEVGSPSTRALIEAEAIRHCYVLVPEPARRNGGVVTGRHAVSRFDLETSGTPSHAGLNLKDGRSAILEMAKQILAVEAMSGQGSTFSVGVVQGGSWVNCVSRYCKAEVLVVSESELDRLHAHERLSALRPHSPGTDVTVTPRSVRPIWSPSEAGHLLYEAATHVARELELDLPAQRAGGGSDANFTGAMGIATLDGLGARGDGAHTLQEHVVAASLEERSRLFAGLLASLC